jgi:arabinose-5-phosphate isomerase
MNNSHNDPQIDRGTENSLEVDVHSLDSLAQHRFGSLGDGCEVAGRANVGDTNSSAEADRLRKVISNVLLTEADAIYSVVEKTEEDLSVAVKLIHDSKGSLIVSGVGKSGHISRKIASTFRSLGKLAVFLHASEASHGDLGMISEESVVLVLSNSGETTELSDLLAYCSEHSIPMISITASKTSTLGKSSTVTIAHGKVAEACVNGLAPTTSTTVALALGDSLAVGVSFLSDIKPQDFRRYHPGGKLGARLLKVADIMPAGDALPIVAPSAPMQEVVIEMSRKGFGTAIVCEGERAIGVITDGDMRRNVDQLWQSCAENLILGPPKAISEDMIVTDGLSIMNAEAITSVIVTDADGQLRGLLHVHDCLRVSVGQEAE